MAQYPEHNQGAISQSGLLSAQGMVVTPGQIIDALRGTLDGSPDLIAVEDTTSRYLAFNRAYHDAFKRVFGIAPTLGASMFEMLAHLPDELKAATELFDRTMRGEDFTVTHEFGDDQIERRTYEIHCFPLYDGEGRLLGGTHIARDVTEQKKVEADLRASESRFRRLVESSSVGLGICDLHGKVFYANEALLKLTGYAPEDLPRTDWHELTPPEYSILDQQAIEQVRAMGTCTPYEKELIAKDGRRVSVMLGFSQIGSDDAGKPVGACFVTDLTRLKRVEAERERLLAEQSLACVQLEGERQKLQTILDHTPAGVMMVDAATGRFTLVNEQAKRILGIECSGDLHDLESRHCLFKTTGEIYEYSEYPIVRAMMAGEVVRDEVAWILNKDGQRLTLIVNSVPICDPQGRILAGVTSFTDITGRQQAEEIQQRFRIALDSAADNIFLIDPQSMRYLDVSQSACRDLGYSREELLALGPPNIMPQLSDEELERRFAEIRANPNSRGAIETVHYRKDGSSFEVEVILRPVEAHGRQLLVAVARDITERKRAEEALRLRNERLTLLSDAAVHLLKAENPDTMILELFEKVSRHLNLQGYMNFMINEDGDALRLDSYAGVPPEAARQVARLEFGQGVCGNVALRCEPIYATHILQSDLDMVQLIKSLGIRAYACNPLFARGRLLGTLAFATTTRDAFSEDELAFMRTICQYVAMAKERLRLEGELRRQNEQLAESDRLKDEFLAMLAHELRNPLAPIRNAVQVMRLTGPDEPLLQRQRDIVDRQVAHMARLLDDLLDVSRITRGKIQFNLRPLSMSDVLIHAVETVMPLIQARHHELIFAAPEEPIWVSADLDRLAQAVGNLLTNAAKYTPEGGKIWLEAVREESVVLIRVRDTGIGIAPEMLPRIFELFTQADQGLAHSQGGLGIGLTLVRRLIQMHGGSVEAHSEGIGQGSEFLIRIPALAGQAQAA